MQTQKINTLDKMVHVPFRKVIKFDLICVAIGVVMGMGIDAFIAVNI